MELYSEDSYGNVTLLSTTELDGKVVMGTRYRLKSGTYYIKELPTYYGYYYRNLDYQFKVVYSAENSDAYETESNNSPDSADNILTNHSYTGNIETEEDADYYKFNVSGSSKIRLQFTQPRETKEETYKIELFNGNSDDSETVDVMLTTSNPVNFGDDLVLRQGTYYVKVTGEGSQEVSMIDYKIQVNETPITLVKDIQLSPSSAAIYSGVKFTMKASVTPANADNKTLEWSSSDQDVATVDKKGIVTCVTSGECYIIAKSTDGGGVTAKYRLVVEQDSNNNLKSIKYSTGTLSDDFTPAATNYTLVINRKNQVIINVTKDSKYADCYISNKKLNKTTVKLNPGTSKTLEIAVVAENGDEKVYHITVKRNN
jgi:hypothetical protein